MSTKTYFINSPEATYNDSEFAWFQSLILTEGVIGDQVGALGLEVIENAVPDMSVLVGVGKALIEITKDGRTFKVVAENNDEEQIVIPANATGVNRVDAIIFRIDKDITPNASKTNVATIERVAGTGATALTDGAIDTAVGNDGWYRLADVTVTPGDTDIVTAQIADTRTIVFFSNGIGFSPLFIASSAGASDAGKVPVLNASGLLDKSFTKAPVTKKHTLTNVFGDATTQFDITNPSGTTFRYTWDTTGTTPNISAATVPIGTELEISGQNFSAANNGAFVVTASGVNYFEVTNALGVVESNKTLGTGSINYCYIPPADLKYVVVEVQATGGRGDSTGGGGGGAYSKKTILKENLSAFERLVLGAQNIGSGNSIFGSHITCGNGGNGSGDSAGGGGTATGGDININGRPGQAGAGSQGGGTGGDSVLGMGGPFTPPGGSTSTRGGTSAIGFGAGGSGNADASDGSPSASGPGGNGSVGIIIMTEFYN